MQSAAHMLLLLVYLLYRVWVFMNVCTSYMPATFKGHKRTLALLGLVVSCHIVLGIDSRPSARASALNS